ncbi:GNAT family N-acetyltransferase [Oscillospiraceae bacterium PP1C4]
MKTDALYRVEKKDFEKLSAIMTECFSKDPLYLQLIPQNDKRQKLLPELFSCDLDELFENCEVYADSEELNGIIVVSDETEPYNPVKYYTTELYYALKSGAYLINEDPSLKTLWNFIKGKEYLNSQWTDDIDTDKRLHIIYFAVRPSMHGKGIASKLMGAVLNYADENKLTMSLETHNEKNVSLYEHYGFRLFEVVQKHFSLKQFCMVR